MPLGASGKFDKYKKEQKNVPIVVNGVEMGSYQLHDNEIDAPDIPKKYREQYRHNLQRTQQYNGDAPLTPRRAWEAEQRIQKQERAEADARKKAKADAKAAAAREKAEYQEYISKPLRDYTPTPQTAEDAAENRRAMWKIIGLLMFVCVIGAALVYGLAKLQ